MAVPNSFVALSRSASRIAWIAARTLAFAAFNCAMTCALSVVERSRSFSPWVAAGARPPGELVLRDRLGELDELAGGFVELPEDLTAHTGRRLLRAERRRRGGERAGERQNTESGHGISHDDGGPASSAS